MHLKVSKRRASAVSSIILFILLAVNSLTGHWFPYIFITIGAPICVRQFLTGRLYDAIVSLAIFGGLFLVQQFKIDWSIILPVVFVSSAILIFFREFFNPYASKEPEDLEDADIEITEDRKD